MNRLQSSFIILVIVFLGFGQSTLAQVTITSNPNTPVCSGTSVTLTATGATTYVWSTGQTGSSIIVTPPTTESYSVIGKDASEVIVGTGNYTVTVWDLPSVNITTSAPSVCAGQPITLTANGTGTFVWSTGVIGQTLTVTPTNGATYWVEITDANGCKQKAYTTITVNPLPNPVGITGPSEVCIGGTVELVATGGVNFLWDDPSATTSQKLTIPLFATTTFTCQIFDANGCMSTAAKTVTVTPALTPLISGDNQLCIGETAVLTASPSGGSYLWSTGATTQSISVTPGSTTNYTVTVTKSGCTASANQTVTVNQKPTPNISPIAPAICRGGSTTLTASADEPGLYDYLWNTGATTPDITVSPSNTTTYSVRITNRATGCYNNISRTVTVDALAAPVITGPTSVCRGTAVTLTVSPGTNYLWDDASVTTTQSMTDTPANTRTYTVWVTNAAGCTYSKTHTVTVTDAPGTTITGNNTICKGSSTTLTAPSGDSYVWNTGSTNSFITVSPLTTTNYWVDVTKSTCVVRATQQVTVNEPTPPTISGPTSICANATMGVTLTSTPGVAYLWSPTGESTPSITVKPISSTTYTVTVTDANGCKSTDSHLVSVTSLPSLSIDGAATVCVGNEILLTVSGAPVGSTYLWSNGSTGESMTATATTSQTYTVTVNTNGCSQTLSKNVTVTPLPTGEITGLTTICKGSTTILTAPAGGSSYYWETTGATTQAITTDPLHSDNTYKVKVTYPGGCEQNLTKDVTVVNLPTGTITPIAPVCLGSEFHLTVNSPDAVDYVWSTGAVGPTMYHIPATAGLKTYWADITNATGCKTRIYQDVMVVAKPVAPIVGPSTFCLGETITLTANGGTSWLWSDGSTTQSIPVTPTNTTTYTVSVFNTEGCETISSYTVTLSPQPNPVITGDLSICLGQSTTLLATGGTVVQWSTGSTGQSITLTPTGTGTQNIWVEVENANGCKQTANATLVVSPMPTASIAASNEVICKGNLVTLTATSGAASYTWSTGATNTNEVTVTPTTSQNYWVDVTNNEGCTVRANKLITVNEPALVSISGATTACVGASTTLTAVGGVAWSWSHGLGSSNSAVVNPATTTTYTCDITDANGCISTATHTLNVTPVTAPSITGNLLICKGGNTTLTSSTADSYLWMPGNITTASLNIIGLNASTDYTLTVTIGGCTASKNVRVDVVDPPTDAVINGADEVCEGSSVILTAGGTATNYLWSTGETTQSITVTPTLASHSYSLTVTNGVAGCSQTVTKDIAVKTKPAVSISGNSSVCVGESLTLTANGTGTFVWDDGTVGNTLTVNPTVSRNYTVTLTNNGCTNTATKAITVNQLPVISVSGNTNICIGGTTTLTATGGDSYFWTELGTSGAVVSVSPLVNTTYHVVVTNTTTGCQNTAAVTVNVHALPTPNITGTTTICAGQSTTLTATGGTSYLWNDGVTTAVRIVNPLVTTTYTVAVTNAAGCTASTSKQVTVNALPTPSITGPTVACKNSSVTLTAAGGDSYVWSTGETTQSITPIIYSTTTYTVTVKNANNCEATTTHTVTMNPAPTATIAGDLDICVGQTTTLTASGGASYKWLHGPTTASITVSPAATTTYEVEVTDANGCKATATSTVVVNPLPTAAITGDSEVCEGSSVQLTATGGVSYLWTPGNMTSQTVDVSPTVNTVYSVVVTGNGGCTATANHAVTVKQIVGLGISGATTSCAGEPVSLTASGGDSYVWDGGLGATATITVSPNVTTTYYVTISKNGCSKKLGHTITVTPKPTITITGKQDVCVGEATALVASGAQSYIWSNGVNTQTNTVTLMAVGSQTYTVTGTDASGCTNSVSVTVTAHAAPTATISGSTQTCAGTGVTLTAGGTGTSYLWSTGETASSIFVNPAATTNYTLVTYNAQGCPSGQAIHTLTVNPIPTASITGPTVACKNSSVTLTAAGGTSYLWSTGETTQSITPTITNNITYTVTVTDNKGCTATTNHTVTVIPESVINISGDLDICVGETTTLTASGVPGGTYIWSNGQGGASITVSPAAETTYTVTATDANGCLSTAFVTVKVNALPTASIIGNTDICPGETTTLTASAGQSWLWTPGNYTTQSINVTPAATTTYSVIITNASGCTATTTHTVSLKSVVAGTISGPTTSCAGTSVTLTASGGSVLWDNGATTPSIAVSPTATTTYYATITGANGCSITKDHTVTITPKPTINIVGNTDICLGQSTTLTASGATSYTWDNGSIGQSIVVSPTLTQTYVVTGTDANGCTNTKSITVTVNPIPVASIAGDNSICEGEFTVLTASGGLSYTWNTGATGATLMVNPTTTTTYSVIAKSASGCESAAANMTVTVAPKPVATITGVTEVCKGEAVTLTANGGTSYIWSTGETTQSISPVINTTTLFTVAVKNASGCETTVSHSVTANPLPIASISGDLEICVGESTTLTAIGGGAGGSYSWDHGAATASVTVTPTTDTEYIVTVTDAKGCKAEARATVRVYAKPNPTISGDVSICLGESATLTANTGTAWFWTPGGATTQLITVTPSTTTTYAVEVTGLGGCKATTNHTVTIKDPVVGTVSGPATSCAGEVVTLIANGGQTYRWDDNVMDGATLVVTPNVTTTYYVNITGSNGCVTRVGHTVTVNPKPTIGVSGNLNICKGASTTLTASGGVSYLWNTGVNTASITVNPLVNTPYTVTVTDSKGCTNTKTVDVTVTDIPVANITGTNAVCEGSSTTLTASGGASYLWSTGATTSSITVSPLATTTYTVVATTGSCVSDPFPYTVTVTPKPIIGLTGDTEVCEGQTAVVTATGGDTYVWSTGQTGASITTAPLNATTVLTVTATKGGCTNTAQQTIVVNKKPAITIYGDLDLCAGEQTTLTATAGQSYLWSNGATTQSITLTPLADTNVSVQVTDNKGCVGQASVNVLVHALPTAGIVTNTGLSSVCRGKSITLTANGGTSYVWETGERTASITVSPLTETTYRVQAFGPGGCSTTAQITIQVLDLPTASVTGPLVGCAGDNITLTASAGTNWLWSTGATTQTITIVAPPVGRTEYTVQVFNAAGCSSTAMHAVVISALPNAVINGDLDICVGESTILTASGGDTYLWNDGSTGSTRTVTPASTQSYSVTATKNGCSKTVSVTVNVNALPTPTISGTADICNGQSSLLTANGGGSYYRWSTGQAGPAMTSILVSPNTTTVYQVEVTNASGCKNTAQFEVRVTQVAAPTISAPKLTICAGESVTLTSSAAPFYQWSSNAGASLNSQSVTVSPTTTTTYTVTTTNNLGCISSASITINVIALPIPTITGNNKVCLGSSTTLTANGGVSYRWNTGATTQSINVSPTDNTTYSVVATNAQGCENTIPVTFTVQVNPTPTVSILGVARICRGTSTVLQATGGVGFLWADGRTTQSITVSPSTTTTYTCTVTDNNGCSAQAMWTVTVDDIPVPSIVGATTICAGASTTLTASGGNAYEWSGGAVGNNASLTVTPATTTTYTVKVTNANGCFATKDVTVTVISQPVITVTGNTNVCAGGSTTLTASCPNAVSYSWSNGGSMASTTVSPTTNTTYTVTVVTVGGCTAIKSVPVTVSALPTPQISAVNSICSGETVTLTASLSGGGAAAYSWNTGATTPSITVKPTTATTYTVTATNASGCQNSVSHTVAVNPLPIATINGPNVSCSGEQVRLIASGAGTGGTYLWSNGFSTQDIFVQPNQTTTYEVTVTNSTGCSTKVQHTVTVSARPAAMITGPTHVCVGSPVTLVASGGTSYTWSTGATGASISVNPPATRTYSVTVRNAAGCDTTINHTVTVLPAPAPTIIGDFIICLGESTTLTVAENFNTYRWNTGATTKSITVNPLSTTLYSVEVTNSDGCIAQAQRSVVVNNLPVATITASSTAVCEGQSVTLTANGAGVGGSYRWSTGEVQQSITLNNLLTNTTVSVVAIASGGCESLPVQQQIVVSTLPHPTITGGSSVCQGGTLQLVASDPDPNVTFVWNDGTVGGTLVVSAAGTYSVTATNAGGCTAQASKTVAVAPLPTPTITASIVGTAEAGEMICAGEAVRLTALPAGDYTYLWNTGETSSQIIQNPVATTTYSVTVTSDAGCSAVAQITIRVNEFVQIQTPTTDVCTNVPFVLSAVGDNLTQFLWSTGETTPNITATLTTPGVHGYWVEARNMKGCISRATTDITAYELPNDLQIIGPDSVCVNSPATLSVVGSVGPTVTYLWSPNGETTANIIVTPAAAGLQTYSCQVTTQGGCVKSLTHTIKAIELPQLTVTGDNSICQGTPTTLTVACASGCVPGTTFVWSNGGTGTTITVSPTVTTTYTVTARTPFGCTTAANYPVTVIPAPQPTITPNPTVICLDEFGVAEDDLILTGPALDINGNPYLAYEWTTTDAPTVVLGTSDVLTLPKAGITTTRTYVLKVTTQDGCIGTVNRQVAVSAKPSVAISGEDKVCQGKSLVLKAVNPVNVSRYEWTANDNPALVLATTATATVWPTATANQFTLTVYNDANCSFETSHTVTILPVPVPNITADNNPICSGDTVVLTASGGGPGALYEWGDGTVGQTLQVNALKSTTTYTVTITNSNGCVESGSLQVVANPLPKLSINGATTVCVGDSVLLVVSDANGLPNTYRWSSSASTGNQIWVKPTDVNNPTTYWVESTDVNTCKSTRVYHSIQAYAKPIAAVAGDRYLCAGEQTTLIASGGTKFKWSNNAQTSQITTPVYTVPGNYMFWVDVYNEANCVTRDTVYVQVSALPSASVTFLEGGSTICQGETIKFQGVAAPAGPIYNYLWTSNNPSEVIDPVAATQPQITFKPQSNTTYYLTVTNTTTGCARTIAQAIVVKPKPAVTLDVTTSGGGTDSICEGQSVTLRVLGGTASFTYVWTKNGAPFAVGVSTITDTPSAGNYTYNVQVTNPATGCSTATDDLIYKVNVAAIAQPTINGLITGGETICEGQTVTLTGNAGGYTYRWESDPTGAIPAGTTINVSPTVTTTYTLIASNATGCERKATYVITVTPKPHITMTSSLEGPNPIICAGEKVTLSLSGTTSGLTYVWTYNGAVIATDVTTITHEPLAPISEYKVIVTNTSGCSTGANELVYTVNVNPVPTPTITLTSGNATICEGDAVILTADNPQQPGYSYMWVSSTPTDVMQPNEYGEEITVYPIATTTYSYTVTDNITGCSRQAQQTIVVNAKPNVTIAGSVTGSNPTICEGSPITVSVTGANLTGLTFEWKKDGNPMVETTSSITDMPAFGTHTYNVIVRSAVGCSSAVAGLSYTVKVTPVPTPTIVAQDADGNVLVAPVCPNSEVTLVGPTGLSSDYAYLWTTNSGEVISNPTQSSVKVHPQLTTTYTLRITNTSTSAQCYREVTKVVDVNVMPTIAVTSSAATVTPAGSAICKGERITLTIKAADGTALAPTKYSFAWVASTGAAIAGNTSAAIQVMPDTTTTYTVTVTNKVTFCKVSTTHKVTVMTIPTDITIVPSVANPVCALTPVTLTASYKDGLSYRWTDSDGNELINNGSDVIVNGNKLTVKPTRNTTYFVQVSNLAGCATSVNYSVVVNPLPTLTVNGPTLFCLGDVGGSFTLAATTNPANALVTWVYGNETRTGSTLTISPTTAGMMNFRVTATNTLTGCVSSEILHSVSVAGVPENTELKVISSTSGEACVDNVVKLEATYGFTRYDFGKTDGTIYTVLQSSNVNIFENLPHTQGTVTYFVDIYNEAGCKIRKELPVKVNPIPSNITVDASGANIFDKTATSVMICEGDSVILAAQDADTGHNTYSWTDTDGKVWGTSQSIKVGPRLTTTYYLTVTNNSGCSLVKSYEVRVTPMDKISVTVSKTEICEGSADAVVLRASGSPTGSYMWTSNEGKQWFNSTAITVYPEVDGTDYIVEAISSTDNRCSSTATAHIEVVKVPTASSVQIIVPTGTNVCPGEVITLKAISQYDSEGVLYRWSTGQIGNEIMVTPVVTTTYWVIASNRLHCENLLDTTKVTITVYPKPTPAVTGNLVVYEGQSTELTATGGVQYEWRDAGGLLVGEDAVIQLQPAATTTYSLTAVGNNGCRATIPVTITVVPFEAIITGLNYLCSGSSTVLTANGSFDEGYRYMWVKPAGAVSQSVTVSTPGTYTVRVTTPWGTSDVASVEVFLSESPQAKFDPPQPTCQGSGNVVVPYTVLAGSPTNYSLTFNAAALAAGFINVDEAALTSTYISFPAPTMAPYGIYQVRITLTNATGCQSGEYLVSFGIHRDNMIVQMWDDVLICDNSSHEFTAYQWFKNNQRVTGASLQYYSELGGFYGDYYVVAYNTAGEAIASCVITLNTKQNIALAPSPIKSNQVLRVVVPFTEDQLFGSELEIFDAIGRSIYRSPDVNGENDVLIQSPPGVYLVRVRMHTGEVFTEKFVVSE